MLLRKALDRTEKVAVAKFVLRGRERLGLLRPLGDALLLSGLHWGNEICSPAELSPPEAKPMVSRAVAVTTDSVRLGVAIWSYCQDQSTSASTPFRNASRAWWKAFSSSAISLLNFSRSWSGTGFPEAPATL